MAIIDQNPGTISEAKVNRIIDQLLVRLPNTCPGMALVVRRGPERELRIFPRAGHPIESFADVKLLWWHEAKEDSVSGILQPSERLPASEVDAYIAEIKSVM